jgi:hypothetical protein
LALRAMAIHLICSIAEIFMSFIFIKIKTPLHRPVYVDKDYESPRGPIPVPMRLERGRHIFETLADGKIDYRAETQGGSNETIHLSPVVPPEPLT